MPFPRRLGLVAALLALLPVAAPAGDPPALTGEERAVFVAAIIPCWSTAGLSPAAQAATVVVGFRMDAQGRPDPGSVMLQPSAGGGAAAVEEAFTAARRAILRCGRDGFPLPPAKYEAWKAATVTFSPAFPGMS